MFNKGLFNRLLFNRILPLFRDAEIVELIGEKLGFKNLEGLFQPQLELNGIIIKEIQQYGNFCYTKDFNGEYKILYYLEGEFIPILEKEDAEEIIDLIGKYEEVDIDGEN